MLATAVVVAAAALAVRAAADPAGEILAALSAARTQQYADALARDAAVRRDGYYGDRAAVAEAVAFLRRQPPMPPLGRSAGLDAVAAAYVAVQGPTGQVGHVGPDGADPHVRMLRQGVDLSVGGEDISYGEGSPSDAVPQFIIDSGVPDRGHRRNIFDRDYTVVGSACGWHRVYHLMCVVDFGGAPRR